MRYPDLAEELKQLLAEDQLEWRGDSELTIERHKRAERALEILKLVGEPTLDNIGDEAAQAVAILATHSSLDDTEVVLEIFNKCFKGDPDNTYKQAIPAMTDWMLILQGKPQEFGTIWLQDESGELYLPTTRDFEGVNERRSKYGIEPLRWPNSLKIDNSQTSPEQPLDELTMRDLTEKELEELRHDYV